MCEMTLHTGCAGDRHKLYVDWFSHNGTKQQTVVEINIMDCDKPRILEILVNGRVVDCIVGKS